MTLRVRRVRQNGFQVRLEEWNYLDGGHTTETVPWLAAEAGAHTLSDGRRIEAGHLEHVDEAWSSQTFSTSFDRPPLVLVQVASDQSRATVAPRIQNVTTSGFQVRLQREEAPTKSLRPETVSWIAIEAGGGEGWATSGDAGVAYGMGLTADKVTDSPLAIPFSDAFPNTPAVLATLQTFDGSDPATLRAPTTTDTAWSVFVEEEQSKDSEVSHTTEVVGWLALTPGTVLGAAGNAPLAASPPTVTAKDSPSAGMTSVVAGPALPAEVVLSGVHPNPSRGVARVRYGLPSEATVTVEVFDALGRRVDVLVDGSQSGGWHEQDLSGRDLPSGLYIVRLQTRTVALTQSFTVAR